MSQAGHCQMGWEQKLWYLCCLPAAPVLEEQETSMMLEGCGCLWSPHQLPRTWTLYTHGALFDIHTSNQLDLAKSSNRQMNKKIINPLKYIYLWNGYLCRRGQNLIIRRFLVVLKFSKPYETFLVGMPWFDSILCLPTNWWIGQLCQRCCAFITDRQWQCQYGMFWDSWDPVLN